MKDYLKTRIFLLAVVGVMLFYGSNLLQYRMGFSNTALVSSDSLERESVLERSNNYNDRAKHLTGVINGWWYPYSVKNNAKSQLKNLLIERKREYRDKFLHKEDLSKFAPLSPGVVSAAENVLGLGYLIEQPVIMKDASISTMYYDDFDNQIFLLKHQVISVDKQYELVTVNDIGDSSGPVKFISGVAFGSELYVPEINTEQINNIKSVDVNKPEPGSDLNNTLVILINFLDSQQTPFSRDQAESLVFGGQFDAFMKEQSFGKVDFEGDVYGWLTLNKDSGSDCYKGDMSGDIDAFAISNNINLQDYSHLLYILNCKKSLSSGVSSVGAKNTVLGGVSAYVSETEIKVSESKALSQYPWNHPDINLPFDWKVIDYLLAHEMGHALGMVHAHGWDCGSNQAEFPCNIHEYGNPFDIMGMKFAFSTHVNAYYKYLMGWLPDSSVLEINKSGVYELSPLESSPPTKRPQLALISVAGSGPIYAVEYRSGSGFDQQLKQINGEGLYIQKIDSDSSLIDSQPTLLEWLPNDTDTKDSLLKSNLVFRDLQAGITINSINGQKFEVTINPISCVVSEPIIQIPYVPVRSFFSQLQFWVYVDNTDNVVCDPSKFKTEILPTSILDSVPAITPVYIQPNNQFETSINFDIVPGTPPGSYPVYIKTTNIESGLSTTVAGEVYVN